SLALREGNGNVTHDDFAADELGHGDGNVLLNLNHFDIASLRVRLTGIVDCRPLSGVAFVVVGVFHVAQNHEAIAFLHVVTMEKDRVQAGSVTRLVGAIDSRGDEVVLGNVFAGDEAGAIHVRGRRGVAQVQFIALGFLRFGRRGGLRRWGGLSLRARYLLKPSQPYPCQQQYYSGPRHTPSLANVETPVLSGRTGPGWNIAEVFLVLQLKLLFT